MMGYFPIYPYPAPPYMRRPDYDADDNIIVDKAEELNDGANVATAAEVRYHVDDDTIHHEVDDAHITPDKIWSSQKIASELTSKADEVHYHIASDISVNTANNNNILSISENTSQKAFDVIDDSVKYRAPLRSYIINTKGEI